MRPIIIARFSRFKWLAALVAAALFLGFVWWSIQAPPASWPFGADLWAFRKWEGMAVIILFYAVIVWCVHELVSSKGVYAWIADGKFHLGREMVPVGDIRDVFIGLARRTAEDEEDEVEQETSILVDLRDGRQMKIDILLISEPAEIVLARLRDALNLRKGSD